MRKLFGLVALAVLTAAGCNEDENRGAPATPSTTVVGTTAAPLPEPRTEVAGTAFEGRVVVVGGLTADGGGSARVDVYDPAADTWAPLPALPVPLHHTGVAVFNDRLWVVGGYSNGPGEEWRPQAAVYSLVPGEGEWRTEPELRAPRGALAVAAAGGKLFAIGGERGGRALADVEILATGDDQWRGGPSLHVAREHLAAASSGGTVYAIAGRAPGVGNFGIVETFAAAKPELGWREVARVDHTRGGIGAAAVGDRVCVAGGEEEAGTIASVECFRDGDWAEAAVLATPRHGLAVAAVGTRLFVIGGGPQPGLTVSDVNERFEIR